MAVMSAVAWAGIFLLIGVFLRAKVPFLRNNLVPASVIGGILGMIVMNTGFITDCTTKEFASITGILFNFTFANMGVTMAAKRIKEKKIKGVKFRERISNSFWSGSLGMGWLWAVPYAFTGIFGFYLLKLIGGKFGMPAIHGLQIPFAFAQGPGQSVTYATMMEANGVTNAIQVGITFASIGFLIAFAIGVPWAKKGIKKGLAAYAGELDHATKKGLFEKEEQKSYGKVTVHPGNLDVLTLHIALVGVAWILGLYLGKAWSFVPGYVGALFSNFLFLNSMMCGYVVRFIIEKLGYAKYFDRETQLRLSGFCTDGMVTSAFMGISIVVIGKWIIPILAVVAVTTIFTYIIARYFGERFGGKYGFERTLAVWGSMTGTVPSGMALVRILDPNHKTTVMEEMGPQNVVNVPVCYVVMPAIIAFSAGEISEQSLIFTLIGIGVAFLVAMLIFGVWGKKTYDYRKGELYYKLDKDS